MQRIKRFQFSLSTLILLTVFLSSAAVSYYRWPEWRETQKQEGVLLDAIGIFSADDARMIHASRDGLSAIVRETIGFKELCILRANALLKRAYISGDGSHAITLTGSGESSIWSIPSGVALHSFKNVASAHFSPDGSNYVLCFKTGDVQIWSTTGELKQEFKELLKGEVLDARLSRGSDQLLTYWSNDPRLGWDAQIQELPKLKHVEAWSSCMGSPSDTVLRNFEYRGHTHSRDGRYILDPETIALPATAHWPLKICVFSNSEKLIVCSSDIVQLFESNHSGGWRGHFEQVEFWFALPAGLLLLYRLGKYLLSSSNASERRGI